MDILDTDTDFFLFLTAQCRMWDLSSPTREAHNPNHWTTREVPDAKF